jgi:hypothetical protein
LPRSRWPRNLSNKESPKSKKEPRSPQDQGSSPFAQKVRDRGHFLSRTLSSAGLVNTGLKATKTRPNTRPGEFKCAQMVVGSEKGRWANPYLRFLYKAFRPFECVAGSLARFVFVWATTIILFDIQFAAPRTAAQRRTNISSGFKMPRPSMSAVFI